MGRKKKSASEEYFDEQIERDERPSESPAGPPDDGEYRSTSTIDNPPKECAEEKSVEQLTLPGLGAYFAIKVAVTLIGETRKAALTEDLGLKKAGSVEVELQRLFQTPSFLSWLRGIVGQPAAAAVDVDPAEDKSRKIVAYIRHIDGERWEFNCEGIGATDWSWNGAADASREQAVAHAEERIRAAGYTGEVEILDDPLPEALRGSTRAGGYKPNGAPYTAKVVKYDDENPAGQVI